ncbi:hypothetical protein P8452_37260 [Trifolium repens]|nr:hypothetical protein P8452_37260 [Trifolium repens]
MELSKFEVVRLVRSLECQNFTRISGRILQLETETQSKAMRRRYQFLSHFPLTTIFQLCEVDLSEILPPEALAPFVRFYHKIAY